jgi:hypothetical protein
VAYPDITPLLGPRVPSGRRHVPRSIPENFSYLLVIVPTPPTMSSPGEEDPETAALNAEIAALMEKRAEAKRRKEEEEKRKREEEAKAKAKAKAEADRKAKAEAERKAKAKAAAEVEGKGKGREVATGAGSSRRCVYTAVRHRPRC